MEQVLWAWVEVGAVGNKREGSRQQAQGQQPMGTHERQATGMSDRKWAHMSSGQRACMGGDQVQEWRQCVNHRARNGAGIKHVGGGSGSQEGFGCRDHQGEAKGGIGGSIRQILGKTIDSRIQAPRKPAEASTVWELQWPITGSPGKLKGWKAWRLKERYGGCLKQRSGQPEPSNHFYLHCGMVEGCQCSAIAVVSGVNRGRRLKPPSKQKGLRRRGAHVVEAVGNWAIEYTTVTLCKQAGVLIHFLQYLYKWVVCANESIGVHMNEEAKKQTR
ncbi:hypothetical protein B0H14DRAFT_2617246 [Mycena olivaceomarginata]|nr:hypothetical protein B0H14DRAFT_2617246 [Mycena olivaceomarginata]